MAISQKSLAFLNNPAIKTFTQSLTAGAQLASGGVGGAFGGATGPILGGVALATSAITSAINASEADKNSVRFPHSNMTEFLQNIPVPIHVGRNLRKQFGFPEGVRFLLIRKTSPPLRFTRGEFLITTAFGMTSRVPGVEIDSAGIPRVIATGKRVKGGGGKVIGQGFLEEGDDPRTGPLGIIAPLRSHPWKVVGFQLGSEDIFLDDLREVDLRPEKRTIVPTKLVPTSTFKKKEAA